MRAHIRQAEEIGDDIVVEPFLRRYWDIERSDFGVPLEREQAQDMRGRQRRVSLRLSDPHAGGHRPAASRAHFAWMGEDDAPQAERLSDIFGDILPVVLHGTGSHWAPPDPRPLQA